MTQKDFIQGLEDYKQKTDLFPHACRQVQFLKKQTRLVRKSAKKSQLPDKQKTKD